MHEQLTPAQKFQRRVDRADPTERAHLLRCSAAHEAYVAATQPLFDAYQEAHLEAWPIYAQAVKDSEAQRDADMAQRRAEAAAADR